MPAFWICQPPEAARSQSLPQVANEMDFPPNTVFAPDTGYPNPLSQTVGCEEDQDPGYTRPPSSRIHIPTRGKK